jgi:magnesium-transporting ATPase (P-type)
MKSEVLQDHCFNGSYHKDNGMVEPSRRTIIIGPVQFEMIKKSEYFLGHFCILMNIYGGMVCYNFSATQKQEIVEFLKKGEESETKCRVIGDGLNDILMMKSSDVIVQMDRTGFFGVHAHVICYDFVSLNEIMFCYCRRLVRNIDTLIYHFLWRGLLITFLT